MLMRGELGQGWTSGHPISMYALSCPKLAVPTNMGWFRHSSTLAGAVVSKYQQKILSMHKVTSRT